MDKNLKKISDIRKTKQKESLLEQLRRTPIVQIACEKVDIGRATYYRWRSEDKIFTELADAAIAEGSLFINDMAESQLISAIKDKNITAIIYWLRHHHPSYTNRLEVTAHLKQFHEELTPEQEALVKEALRLASLVTDQNKEISNSKTQNDESNQTTSATSEVSGANS